MIKAQTSEWGDLEKKAVSEKQWLVNEEGILVLVTKSGLRVIIPKTLRLEALKRVHGDADVGHFGLTRSAVRLISKFFWQGWREDLKTFIKKCLRCEMVKLGRSKPPAQALLKIYQVSRRFEMVAMDIFEISSASDGYKILLVIGDCLTIFIISVPIKNEEAKTVAEALFEKWISIFGPPENLLSGRGTQMVGGVITNLCRFIGTKKVNTTSHHPQTHRKVERYNKTLVDLLQKELIGEEQWLDLVPLVTFQYNTSQHRATLKTPYESMFGAQPFEIDHGMFMTYCMDKIAGSRPLADRLRVMHAELFSISKKAKQKNAKQYNKAVALRSYEVGEEVYVFNIMGLTCEGRKLRPLWFGPYKIIEKLSDLGYIIKGVANEAVARTHVNRLRRASTMQAESEDPMEGMFPDSFRLLRSLLDSRGSGEARGFKLKSVGRNGYVWLPEAEVPEVVIAAYDLRKSGRQART